MREDDTFSEVWVGRRGGEGVGRYEGDEGLHLVRMTLRIQGMYLQTSV